MNNGVKSKHILLLCTPVKHFRFLISWLMELWMFIKIPHKSMTSAFTKTVVRFVFFYVGFWVEKQNLQQREMRGIFPLGFATAHLEVIREPGRPVSQAGALLAGQDELGERGSSRSRSVSRRTRVSLLRFISFILFLSLTHHCDRIESSKLRGANKFIMEMAGEQVELSQRRKGERSVPFSICLYVYLPDLSIYFSVGQPPARGVWGIRHMSVVCGQVCVCV